MKDNRPLTSAHEDSHASIEILVFNQVSWGDTVLRKPKDLEILSYADASYGGEEARSQMRVLMTLENQAVWWYSRRQDIVSL